MQDFDQEIRRLRWIVATIAVLLGLVVLGSLFKLLLRAEVVSVPGTTPTEYEPGISTFDDSADRLSWLTWLISPLLVWGVSLLLGSHLIARLLIPRKTQILYLATIIAVISVMYVVFLADLPLKNDLNIVSPIPGMITSSVLLAGVVAAVTRYRLVRVSQPAKFTRGYWGSGWQWRTALETRRPLLLVASVIISILLTSGLLLRMVVRTGEGYDTYHAPFVWSDLLAPFTGAFPLATYVPQYNAVLGLFVEPWFNLFGSSDESLSTLMALFALAVLLIAVLLLSQFWGLVASGALAAICVSFGLSQVPVGGAGGYFQVYPLRFVLPALTIACFAICLKRRTSSNYFIFGLCSGVSALNNFEWGLTSSIAALLVFFLVVALEHRRQRLTFRPIAWVASGAVTGFVFLIAAIWIRSGLAPNPLISFDFARMLGGTDNMVSAPILGTLQVMLATFVVACAWSLFRLLGSQARVTFVSDSTLLLMGIYGLVFAIYPFGRSLPVVNYALYFWWALTTFSLLGSFVVDRGFWTAVRKERYLNYNMLLMVPLLLLALAMAYIGGGFASPLDQVNRLQTVERPNQNMIEKTLKSVRNGGNVDPTVFAFHGGRQIAAQASMNDYLPFNSSVSLGISRRQTSAVISALFDSNTQRAIIWAPCCTPGPFLNLLSAAGFTEYSFASATDEGAGPLTLRRIEPMGDLVATSRSANFKLRISVPRQAIMSVTPEAYSLTVHVLTSGNGRERSPTRFSWSTKGLFVPNAVALSNEGQIAIAGSRLDFESPGQPARWSAQIYSLDPQGETLWSREFGSTGPGFISAVSINSRGDVLFGGGSTGGILGGSIREENTMSIDSFLGLMSSTGEILQVSQSDFGGDDQILSLGWVSDESFIWTGTKAEGRARLVWGESTIDRFSEALAFQQYLGECPGIQSLVKPLETRDYGAVAHTGCSVEGGVSSEASFLLARG